MQKLIRIFVVVILVFIILICGSLALVDFVRYWQADREYNTVITRYIKPEDEQSISYQEENSKHHLPYPDLDIDYAGLISANEDFVCVLYMPVLDIQYPVALSKDDKEYLKKTFEGTQLSSGCVFMEKDSKPDFSGWNTWLFGHNMKNGSMFGSLKNFLNESELCSKDPYFYIYTKDKILKYRIFAYHTTDLGGTLYRYVNTEDEYDQFLKDIRKESVYKEGSLIGLFERPRIVTLSTCHGRGHIKSFVVHGAIIGEYENEP